jgi:hypothetical protein
MATLNLKRITTMKKMTKILLIALGFSLLTVALGFLTSRPAPAQAPPPTVPVTVKNTTAQPVPTSAQGTTTVAGSVTALQDPNRPAWLVRAAQSGPWNVGISGTPNININGIPAVTLAPASGGPANNLINPLNSNGVVAPLIVQDLNTPRYPFTISVDTYASPSSQPTITFPAAITFGQSIQEVVIESVTAGCTGLPSQNANQNPYFFHVTIFQTGAGNQGGTSQFHFQGASVSGFGYFYQQTKLYTRPSTSVYLFAGGNTGCDFSLSGYYIPVYAPNYN